MTVTQRLETRLNLGSGPTAVPGWVNIDRSPNIWLDRVPGVKPVLHRAGILNDGHMISWSREIQRHDIRKLPYPSRSVDAIYSSHALEHLYLDEAQAVLEECARVLRRGRILRLALPDATRIAEEFLAGSQSADAGREFNQRLLARPTSRPGFFKAALSLVTGHTHFWQPTAPLVKDMLLTAGFTEVEEYTFMEGQLPGLSEIETRPESFFLEARL